MHCVGEVHTLLMCADEVLCNNVVTCTCIYNIISD